MQKASVQESNVKEETVTAVELGECPVEDTPDQVIVKRLGVFGPLVSKLFRSGVEARGVERVPENEREPKNIWNNLFMWWSATMVLSSIPGGTLGQYLFTLTLPHTIATLLCFFALGCVGTAFIATLGPQTGLRTMIITRYSSGYIGCTFYSILNILTQIGFGTIVVIVGGQTLASINPGTIPLVVGIIIIGVCCLVPCFIGYNMVHAYVRYAWIVMFFVMCCMYGLGGRAGYDLTAQKPFEDIGGALVADILSFGGIAFAGGIGWASVAADYNCRLPANTNPWRVFMLTFCGLFLSSGMTILGATLMTITNPTYAAAFGTNGNTGALIAEVLSPWGGGGKFLLVLLSLGLIANNILNTYSAALSIQALGRPFAMVPRFLWVIFVFLVYTVAAVAGRGHFNALLSNVLSILGYWSTFFVIIVAEEHFLFRRKGGRLGGYNLEDWDNPSRLPVGIAGALACCFGIVGAVVGMSHSWYTGPIAKMAGVASHGADLGFELAACFSAVTFAPLRWLEIHLTGR